MTRIIICCIAMMLAFSSARAESQPCVQASVAAPKPKKELKTVNYRIKMHCKECVLKINENIAFEKGVKGLDVSLEKQTVKITYDPSKTDESRLKAALARIGYKVIGNAEDGDEKEKE
ncbi:MAG: heavy-metal-associated domain-containing protein [Candidatus Cryptobacteroides sp.]